MAEDGNEQRAAHVATMLEKLVQEDDYAAIEYAIALEDRRQAIYALHDLVFKVYYDRKDIAETILVAQTGIALALDQAKKFLASDPKMAHESRALAKMIAYNLASFCWPGWAEEGIALDANTTHVGYEAAKLCLRLSIELNQGDIPISRAYWLMGAHELSAHNHGAAIQHFQQAHDLASKHEDGESEALLSLGYAALTKLVAAPADEDAKAELETVKAKLKPMKDGEFFIGQLDVAASVFVK